MRIVARFNIALLACFALTVPALQAAPVANKAQQETINQRLSGMQIPFIENKGQADKSVAFYAPTFAGTVFVTNKGELVYALPARNSDENSDGRTAQILTERMVDGKAVPAPLTAAATKVSYFLGNDQSKWQRDVSTHRAVSLGEVWNGIDVELHAYGKNVEKFFTVRPGASVDTIKVQLDGAASLKIGQDGALDVATDSGVVRFTPPIAWQEKDGNKLPVQVAYLVQDDSYGFQLGQHDTSLPVVIDPLLQSTYLGGSGNDYANAIATHPTSGDIYVAGYTTSTNFPGVAGGVQESLGTYSAAFLARLNSNLTTLIQSTYLGGNGFDYVTSIAIHPATGDVYLAGSTYSSDFPGTNGGAQATLRGVSDVYVARFDSSLTSLSQSTYLGGDTSAFGGAGFGNELYPQIVMHPVSGEVYVSGATNSIDFPGTTGGAQAVFNGGTPDQPYTKFVARLNTGLTSLIQSTYLGSMDPEGYGTTHIAIHPMTSEIYVTGYTVSTDFPGTSGGAQEVSGGYTDTFVARLTSDLTGLLQATYLGSSGTDAAYAISIHPASGDIYIAGSTDSANFPGTIGGVQATYSGLGDAFIARLNSSLTTLTQSTFLGTSSVDIAFSLAIDSTSSDVFVAGDTSSASFTGVAGGAQSRYSGGGRPDSYITRLNSSLTSLVQSTYVGSGAEDGTSQLVIHPITGDVYLTGFTNSASFPGVAGGAQSVYGKNYDGYVSRLTPSLALNDYTLTAAKSGAGTVSSADGLINCGIDCSEIYGNNRVITLSASPDANYTFTGWAGACTNPTGNCIVTMDASKTATANFSISTYALSVSKTGGGTGVVTTPDNLINCGTDCTENYSANTNVTLTAAPSAGSLFANWSGACSGNSTSCTVTMDAAKTVTAKFNLSTYALTVSKLGTGSGTVTSSDGLINCGADCTENYAPRSVVTLTATPNVGSTFAGWSGSCSGTGTCTVSMTAAKTVKARFNAAALNSSN